MEKQEQVNIILGSVLLYTVVTSLISLPGRIGMILIESNTVENVLISFIKINILWLIVVIAIIAFLNKYIRKSNQTTSLNLLANENIRLTAGALFMVEGLINLANILPLYILNIQTMLKTSYSVGDTYKIMVDKVIIVDIISVLLLLCKVFLGIYLIKIYKSK